MLVRPPAEPRSRWDRLRGRKAEDGPPRCRRCEWTVGTPAPPRQAPVGSGVFRLGSTVASRVGSLVYEDLSPEQADELAVVASSLGDPVADDVRAAVDWFVERHPQAHALDQADGWADLDAAEVPWWCWFRDGAGLFVPLGPDVCRDIDAMAASVVHWILRSRPGAAIRASTGKDAVDSHFRRPVVGLPGGAEVLVVDRFITHAHRHLVPWAQVDLDGIDAFVRSFGWVEQQR